VFVFVRNTEQTGNGVLLRIWKAGFGIWDLVAWH